MNLNEWVAMLVANETRRIERDLIRAGATKANASEFEIIRQQWDKSLPHYRYRGIRRNGEWVIDHYPDWPCRD